jgi:methyl acetate hydrolase
MKSLNCERKLDRFLQDAVASRTLPGVVALIATGGEVLYESSFGVRDAQSGAAIGPDTVFNIASMTKAVTAAAVLQLTELGQLDLDQPVADVLPAFADLQVLIGFSGDTPVLRPPARQATVRELLANVSGLGYDTWNQNLWRYQALTGIPNISAGRRRSFALPLLADPGTQFIYGTGTDWAGLLVEQVSGLGLDGYFREYITGPLGMQNTDVQLTAEQRLRLAAVHVRDTDGVWKAVQNEAVNAPEFYAGGHCLYSTPRDFLRFQRLLLSGGTLDGIRILRPASVASMLTNQIGQLRMDAASTCNPDFCRDLTFPPMTKWGLGLTVSGGIGNSRPAGSAGWSGVCNTVYWIDPVNDLAVALYSQTLPFRDPAILQVFCDFEHALYQSI